MPRGRGRGRRGRGRRYSPIGIPGLRPGDSFGSSHNHGGSAVPYVLAFFVWMFLFGLAVFNKPVPPAPTSSEPESLPQLEIYYDQWEHFSKCYGALLKTEGSIGYGNVSLDVEKTTDHSYFFKVNANGFDPAYLRIRYVNNTFPEFDVFTYSYLVDTSEGFYEVHTQSWTYPEWKNRTISFRTSSGETGLIVLEKNFLLFGVIDDDLKRNCAK